MTAPGAVAADAISVAELTNAAKEILEGAFPPLWVKGEVSSLTIHRNGQWYFTLKDAHAEISCVVWSRDTRGIPAKPTEGMQVMARGRLTVWTKAGKMQFAVTALEAEGEGLWKKQFDETKAKLEREGLLDPARKRRLPRFPRTVAVITSPDGAAVRDILSVITRRHPGVSVVILPAAVQGDTAPDSLVAAFGRLDRWVRGAAVWQGTALSAPDVVIIGRGGGSREDLWAFNHEQVARAIAACPVPTISAVGHETDFTIADFVADVRAATPSVAAETAVPVLEDLVQFVAKLGGVMIDGLQDRIEVGSRELHRRADGLSQRARRVTERRRARTEQIVSRLVQRAPRMIERRKAQIEAFGARLDALSPLAVLGRGFAVARSVDGQALGRRNAFTAGTKFDLLLQDGRVRATADSIHTDAPHLRKDATP